MAEPGRLAGRLDGAADVGRAVAALAERLPAPLTPLATLAYNYRWSWSAGGAAVFRTIDPLLWKRSDCNPRHVIEVTSPHRLGELAQDAAYVSGLRELASGLRAELGGPWAETAVPPDRPVAYLSSEFAVHCSLPFYGGGLGVLAGDFLKAASDERLPLVGVGLAYRQGYMHQRLDPSGWQHEYWTNVPFELLPMARVSGPDARPLTIEVELCKRVVRVAVWRVDVGRVPLYLLDADGEENDPIDRWITARLYVGDRRIRIAQYAVLGVGGIRALHAMGIRPSVVHLNEGHGAFANLERIRLLLAAGGGLDDAIAATRATTAFTTHTPVAAGNETYDAAEIDAILADYLDGLGAPRAAIHDLARARPDGGVGLTVLALRTSGIANGVSRRHGEVAREMWRPLWPGRPASGVPIGHVTNGVHTGSWMAAPMAALLDRHVGPRWRERPADPGVWDAVDAIPDAELWQARCALRRDLVGMVRERSVRDRLGRGEPLEYVAAAADTFDDRALTIGFARRMATYKRFYLLTREAGRGLPLLDDAARPIQLVVAGRAHPQDEEAKNALRDLFQIKRAPTVGKHVAFLEDYDLHLAPRIVAGVDLWLNLPRPPLEASGTSGMKVTLNGGLNLSVLDGWWIEGFDARLGWAIDSPNGDPQAQDAHDVQAVFDLLEREIIPEFYARGPDGVPHAWLGRIKHAMRILIPRFAADRMLRDYVGTVYAPLLAT